MLVEDVVSAAAGAIVVVEGSTGVGAVAGSCVVRERMAAAAAS